MEIQAALKLLDLGSSVAESDEGLRRYFVVTSTYLAIANDRADIVFGEKGAGKTALYQSLTGHYASNHGFAGQNIEIVPAFNPRGQSIFHKLVDEKPLQEIQYIAVWKTYFLALAGNWLLELADKDHSKPINQLYRLLDQSGLLGSENTAAESVFARCMTWMRRHMRISEVGVEMSTDPGGTTVLRPHVRLADNQTSTATSNARSVSPDEGLLILDEALTDVDLRVWIALDRLDEAFIGFPEVEIPALRALLRTYLDFSAYDYCRLKLFLRNDLFRKITDGGFVNLTHVNARMVEIVWDKEDLLTLVLRRIKENEDFTTLMGLAGASDDSLWDALFPPYIEGGGHRINTWNWILTHIRDGNGVCAPRNLIDLINIAREEQERRELRRPRADSSGMPLIEVESLKKAVERLGDRRIKDTLQAEGGKELTALIAPFREGKSIHNEQSLSTLWHVNSSVAQRWAQILTDVGFLEQTTEGYKVPPLYQAGLKMTAGRAF